MHCIHLNLTLSAKNKFNLKKKQINELGNENEIRPGTEYITIYITTFRAPEDLLKLQTSFRNIKLIAISEKPSRILLTYLMIKRFVALVLSTNRMIEKEKVKANSDETDRTNSFIGQ